MPKYFDVTHNSPEWEALRLGIATSSCFDRIITPGGKLSSQADGYANELIAEMMLGRKASDFNGNYHTERGHELEPDAREVYQEITDNEVVRAGFITDEKFRFGCSPDGAVVIDGKWKRGLEIKCPSNAAVHIDYLINKTFDKKYKPQYQGHMLIGGFECVDFFSYHPELPPAYFTIDPDEEYLATMKEALEEFHTALVAKVIKLQEAGHLIGMPNPPFDYTEQPNILTAC